MTIDDLINKIEEYNPDEVERVRRAYEYASVMHIDQKRQSGEPYIVHPLSVTYILAELHADGDTLCAGLLHDTLEDTRATKEELIELFGNNVAMLVDGVTNFNKNDFKNSKDEDAANIRKIINSLTTDVRIVIIKLADRLHNMRTLEYKSREKQQEKALETMELYVPLAQYVGVNNIKSELEDLSFMYLKEDYYKRSKELREELVASSDDYLRDMVFKIREILNNNGIPNEMKIRIKNIYGVYRRLIRKDRDPHDLIAIKVMVEEVNKCYSALGYIHGLYHPIHSRFKDYISSPKSNMYQSLHTTVLPENGEQTQIQIRTKEMDDIATYGLPIYWDLYRELGTSAMASKIGENKGLLSSISELNDMHPKSDRRFVKEIKRELFEDRIEVYTKTGDVISLPKGSTPVDFAYLIHTEVGNHMVGAIVNGEIVSFSYKLKPRDRVEIITNDLSSTPPDIRFAKTTHARRRIREYVKAC